MCKRLILRNTKSSDGRHGWNRDPKEDSYTAKVLEAYAHINISAGNWKAEQELPKQNWEFSLGHSPVRWVLLSQEDNQALQGKIVTQAPKSSQGWIRAGSSGHSKPKAGLDPCTTPCLLLDLTSLSILATCQDENIWRERKGGWCWPVGILSLSNKVPRNSILPITSEFLNILSPQDKFECSSKHVPGKGHAKGFQTQTEALSGAELFWGPSKQSLLQTL